MYFFFEMSDCGPTMTDYEKYKSTATNSFPILSKILCTTVSVLISSLKDFILGLGFLQFFRFLQ